MSIGEYLNNSIQMISKIHVWKSLKILRRVRYSSEKQLGFPPVLLFRKSYTKISESAVIVINGGKLYFNDSWIGLSTTPSLLNMGDDSQLRIHGRFHFYSGSKVYVHKNATLSLGSGFVNNDSIIRCSLKVDIGNDVAISERVSILDSDYHQIIGAGEDMAKPIKIGNHVWVGINATILKGVSIGDNAIIAAGAVVNKDVPANCLVGGVPARVLRRDVNWR